MAANDHYQIFISYRRDGGEHLSRLIRDRLMQSGYRVFLDVETLREGYFDDDLYQYIDQCKDIIVILSPHGLDRCFNKDDWVRKEIARGLQKKKNVIPFIMRNFEFPENLPQDILPISRRNGIHENHEYFSQAIAKLISFLESTPTPEAASNEQLRQAVEQGDTQAMNELALRYELGSDEGIRQQAAHQLYIRAARNGDPAAMYNLADIYETCACDPSCASDYGITAASLDCRRDELSARLSEMALALYKQARKAGFKPACFRLGNRYEEQKNFSAALKMYRDAAPYPPALNALGYYYNNGVVVEANLNEAVSYYKAAADCDYAPGIYNYARSLELIDPTRAIRLYHKIAFGEHAIPEASYCLAKLYENRGEYSQAINCYRIARDNGIREAETAINRCQGQWSEMEEARE